MASVTLPATTASAEASANRPPCGAGRAAQVGSGRQRRVGLAAGGGRSSRAGPSARCTARPQDAAATQARGQGSRARQTERPQTRLAPGIVKLLQPLLKAGGVDGDHLATPRRPTGPAASAAPSNRALLPRHAAPLQGLLLRRCRSRWGDAREAEGSLLPASSRRPAAALPRRAVPGSWSWPGVQTLTSLRPA